ncbi:hypothetical protein DIPPA_06714 [Diplonema papillatum]|nr:hypothetical protein DIPPA_06714 [Diplonema papillatum]
MSITGTVAKWNVAKGWGFVKSNSDETDYYVNVAMLVGGTRLQEGGEVQFDEDVSEAKTKKEKEFKEEGKKRASNVSGLGVIAASQGSQMGTVCEWYPGKGFGFVLSTDGNKVYVHSSAFDGAKLQVGKSITYDTEDVGHKSGRQVAVNVAGPAVLPRAGTTGTVKNWLFQKGFGFAEDANSTEVFVHASQINSGWLMANQEIYYDVVPKEGEAGKFSAVNVSGPGVRDAEQAAPMFKGFKGAGMGKGGKGRKAGGGKNAKGGKPDGEEKRKDVDGNLYTKAEFLEQYGGTKEWDAKETRQSPANGNYYGKEQFVAHFGGVKEWNAAKAGAAAGGQRFNPLAAKKKGRGGGRGAK